MPHSLRRKYKQFLAEKKEVILPDAPLPVGLQEFAPEKEVVRGYWGDNPLAKIQEKMGRRYGLTLREVHIVALLIDGLTTQEIADRAAIKIKTVKFHLTSIMVKMGVKSRYKVIIKTISILNGYM